MEPQLYVQFLTTKHPIRPKKAEQGIPMGSSEMADIAGESREDIWDSVYSRNLDPQRADLMELTPAALSILTEIDGQRSFSTIATELNIKRSLAISIALQLVQLDLIKDKYSMQAGLDPDFRPELEYRFASLIGPMARVLIRDAIRELGFIDGGMTREQGAELVELLSNRISLRRERVQFIKQMVDFICRDSS